MGKTSDDLPPLFGKKCNEVSLFLFKIGIMPYHTYLWKRGDMVLHLLWKKVCSNQVKVFGEN